MISDGEDFEILEPSFVVGGHQKWSSYFGKQSGNSSVKHEVTI
jgi:hypothetical protein